MKHAVTIQPKYGNAPPQTRSGRPARTLANGLMVGHYHQNRYPPSQQQVPLQQPMDALCLGLGRRVKRMKERAVLTIAIVNPLGTDKAPRWAQIPHALTR